MSLERLQELILNQAKTRSAEVTAQLQATLEQEKTRIAERAKQIEEQVLRQAELEGNIQANQVYQTSRLEARADVLRAKQAELDTVKAELLKQIGTWPKDTAQDFLAGLFKLLPEDKEGQITPGELHQDIVKSLAHKHKIKVADDTIAQEGGFVYTSPTVEMDLTTSRLVDELFTRHRTQLAQKLFS